MNFYDYPVTSAYGKRNDPITGKASTHYGIDYGLPLNTEILSNVSGTVVTSSFQDDGYGNYVVVKDGTGKLHIYGHMNSRSVNVGDTVSVNQKLGLSGSTGYSTGPHLHYEVKNTDGTRVDPNLFTQGTTTNINNESTTETKGVSVGASSGNYAIDVMQNTFTGDNQPVVESSDIETKETSALYVNQQVSNLILSKDKKQT